MFLYTYIYLCVFYVYVFINVYVYTFLSPSEGRSSCLFKHLAYFGRRHYPKDTRQAVFEWLELEESVLNVNVQENNFVIHPT